MDLHDQVLSYGGADHFGAGISGPFNYARVLFCCHRFGDAIGDYHCRPLSVLPPLYSTLLT